jgi:AraC-like DNA-binding protein
MQEAINWLRESSEPIGELAYQMGYQSEAAFNRAFKNFIGKTPGSFRRNVAL